MLAPTLYLCAIFYSAFPLILEAKPLDDEYSSIPNMLFTTYNLHVAMRGNGDVCHKFSTLILFKNHSQIIKVFFSNFKCRKAQIRPDINCFVKVVVYP